MKTFEDIQRGLMQVILDYHASKKKPVDTELTSETKGDEDTDDEITQDVEIWDDSKDATSNTWTKITSRLSHAIEPSPLDVLLDYDAEGRNRGLDTYIAEATTHTQTRRELLMSLKEIISLLDTVKNIQATDTPETYSDTFAALTERLVTLQQNIPRSGDAHTALNTFFCAMRHTHVTLAVALAEQIRTVQETVIQKQTTTIQFLDNKREELSIQNRALQQMLARQYPQEPTATPKLASAGYVPPKGGSFMTQFKDWLATHSSPDSETDTQLMYHPAEYL